MRVPADEDVDKMLNQYATHLVGSLTTILRKNKLFQAGSYTEDEPVPRTRRRCKRCGQTLGKEQP